jgi:hypothetical protein
MDAWSLEQAKMYVQTLGLRGTAELSVAQDMPSCVCVLSGKLMRFPVLAADGWAYEEDSITAYCNATLDEDQKYTIARAKTRMRWKAEDQLAANEVPEVAFLLKLVIAQQVAYEALGQRTEMVRQRLKDYQNYQKYCEEARVAVQTLERVKAALRGEVRKGPSDSFWQSIGENGSGAPSLMTHESGGQHGSA